MPRRERAAAVEQRVGRVVAIGFDILILAVGTIEIKGVLKRVSPSSSYSAMSRAHSTCWSKTGERAL
jgi:hypothetical protein